MQKSKKKKKQTSKKTKKTEKQVKKKFEFNKPTLKFPKIKLGKGRLKVLIVVILLLVFIGSSITFLIPYIPEIAYRIKPVGNEVGYAIPQELADNLKVSLKDVKPIPKENRLIIPKINVDAEILEGETLSILDQKEGVWREPFTKTPEIGGNMVIAGHRFQYTPPNTKTFYHLDKLQNGDKILVFWKEKTYIYEIVGVKDVLPTQVDILNDDPGVPNKLTLYTCTPLGSNAKRLVIEASLIK